MQTGSLAVAAKPRDVLIDVTFWRAQLC